MPYVLAANMPAIEDDAAYLARCLGLGAKASDLLAWIGALRREVGIPNSLAEAGVPAGEVGRIAQMAVEDPSAGTNPIAFFGHRLCPPHPAKGVGRRPVPGRLEGRRRCPTTWPI